MDFETAIGIALGAIMYAFAIYKVAKNEISKAAEDSRTTILLETQNKVSELKLNIEKTISDVINIQSQAHSGEIIEQVYRAKVEEIRARYPYV